MESKGSFIWFLDSDSVIVNSDCLRHGKYLKKTTRPSACVGGELINEEGADFVRVDENKISRKLKLEENLENNFKMVKVGL